MSVTTRITDDDIGLGDERKTVLPLGLSPDDVNCPICVETISDPFVTSCGHTFCYQCISTQLKHKNSCPSCGDYLTADNIYPNFLLNKILRKAAAAPASGRTSLVDQVQRLLAENMAADPAVGPHSAAAAAAPLGGVAYGNLAGGLGLNSTGSRGLDAAAGGGGVGGLGGGGGSAGGGVCRLRLRDIDAVLEALYDAREELERRESSDVLHLLLCFLQHAREHKARQMAKLRQQLACLEHDVLTVQMSYAAGAAAAVHRSAQPHPQLPAPTLQADDGGDGGTAPAPAAAAAPFSSPNPRPAAAAAAGKPCSGLFPLPAPTAVVGSQLGQDSPRRHAPAMAAANAGADADGSGDGGGGFGGTAPTSGDWLRRAHPHLVSEPDGAATSPGHPRGEAPGSGDVGAAAAASSAAPPAAAVTAVQRANPPEPQAQPQHQHLHQRQREAPPQRSELVHRPPIRRSSWCLHTFTAAGSISSVTIDTSNLLEPGQEAEAFSAAVQHAMAAARAGGGGVVASASISAASGDGAATTRSPVASWGERNRESVDGGGRSGDRSCYVDAGRSATDGVVGGLSRSAAQQDRQEAQRKQQQLERPSGVPMGPPADAAAAPDEAAAGGGCAAAATTSTVEEQVVVSTVTTATTATATTATATAAAGGPGSSAVRRMPRFGSADNFQLLFGCQAQQQQQQREEEQHHQHTAAAATRTETRPSASGDGDFGDSGAGGGDDRSALSGAAYSFAAQHEAQHVQHQPQHAQPPPPQQQPQQVLPPQSVLQQGPSLSQPPRHPHPHDLIQDGTVAAMATASAAAVATAAPLLPSGTGTTVVQCRPPPPPGTTVVQCRPPPPPGTTVVQCRPPPPPGRPRGRAQREDEEEEEDEMDVRERRRGRWRPSIAPPQPLQPMQGTTKDAAVMGAGPGTRPPPAAAVAAPRSGDYRGTKVEMEAEVGPAEVQAAKRRRMLSQFDVLERCYLQMRAARPSSSAGSAAPESSPAAAAMPLAALAPAPAAPSSWPPLSAGGPPQLCTVALTAAAAAGSAPPFPFPGTVLGARPVAAAVATCDGAHPHRPPSGPDGLCSCEGHTGAGGAGADLSFFGAVLAAATQHSRLELLAEIPRHGSSGSVYDGAGTAAAAAGGGVRGPSGGGGGLQILSSIEFDLSDDLFATAGVVPRILVYDYQALLTSRQAARPVTELTARSKLSCLSYSHAVRQHLLAADYQGGVALWDTATSMQVQDFEAHERRVWGVDFSPVRRHCFASGSDDGMVKVWSTGQPSSCLALELRGNVCSVEFHPTDPNLLAVGSALHCAVVYDIRQPAAPLHTLLGHRKAVSYVRWLPNHPNELVTASTDSTLKLWSLSSATAASPSPSPATGAGALPAFLTVGGADVDDDKVAAAAAADPGGGGSDPFLGGAQLVRTFSGHVNERNFVGLCAGGDDYIACGSESHEVVVYQRSIPQPALRFGFSDRLPEGERGGGGTGGAGPGPSIRPSGAGGAAFGAGSGPAAPHHFVTALQWRRNSPHLLAANSAGYVWLLGLRL